MARGDFPFVEAVGDLVLRGCGRYWRGRDWAKISPFFRSATVNGEGFAERRRADR